MSARPPANKYVAELRLLDTYFAASLQGMLASDLADRRVPNVVAQALLYAQEAVDQRNMHIDKRMEAVALANAEAAAYKKAQAAKAKEGI